MRWYELRPVDMSFVTTAKRIYVMEGTVAFPPEAVWDYVTDPSTWNRWFPGLRSARYDGEPPHGVGAKRVADMGLAKYEETILTWDEPHEWAYRIDRATLPIATAQVESTQLKPIPGGTRLRWILATDPRLLLKVASPRLERRLRSMWTQALLRLEAQPGLGRP